MKIYLTRHGQTEWNLKGVMQGHLNSNLTGLGVDQAKWLGHRLKEAPLDIICSSSSGRAMDTAKHIRGDRSIEIEAYDDLKEINLGHWQGMKHEDIEGNYSDDYHNFWHRPENFEGQNQESFELLIKRARRCLDEIVAKYEGQDILIVSHGVTLKAILASVKGAVLKDFWQGPFMKSACLCEIHYINGEYTIVMEGDTSHYIV